MGVAGPKTVPEISGEADRSGLLRGGPATRVIVLATLFVRRNRGMPVWVAGLQYVAALLLAWGALMSVSPVRGLRKS